MPALAGGLPVVILNGASTGDHLSVLPAERAAGSAVAETLLAAGHRRIGVIGVPGAAIDPRVSVFVTDRLDGIFSVLDAADVQPPTEATGLRWEPQSGYRATQRILADHPHLTALICLNDRLAFGAYQALQELGRPIPAEVSVVWSTTTRSPRTCDLPSPRRGCRTSRWGGWRCR